MATTQEDWVQNVLLGAENNLIIFRAEYHKIRRRKKGTWGSSVAHKLCVLPDIVFDTVPISLSLGQEAMMSQQ